MKFAKTFKKFFAATIAAAASVCTFTSFSAYAAEAAPRVYVDLNYVDENTARADVIFENFDEITFWAFKIDVGDYWDIVIKEDEYILYTPGEMINNCVLACLERQENIVSVGYLGIEDKDLNGVVFSFYLTKSGNESGSKNVSYLYTEKNKFQSIEEVYGKYYVDTTYHMLDAYEYLVGDVDGNGFISPVDATAILTNYNQNGALNVHDIRTNYKEFFANATCAASADANQDGIINADDANCINEAYVLLSMGITDYDSMAGKYDYFEIYND